jgi:3-dehydroquinate synthase
MQQSVSFPSGTVNYIFQSNFEELWKTYDKQHVVIITNDHLARQYSHLFKAHKTLVIPPVEGSKDLHTIEHLAKELLRLEATRKTTLIGVGGGVVTDIVGFLASIYMRGVPFGFVPTTLLGMVDASVGGKNGVNMGLHKNILGAIRQPEFILYDTRFLQTLQNDEWSNGFAEIIKCALIFDPVLFEELCRNTISYYKRNNAALIALIEQCVAWKNKVVTGDEREHSRRKLLNFGHTAAHSIENVYELSHGKAVGIGMVIACMLSETVAGLDPEVTRRLKGLLQQYHLPVRMNLDAHKAMDILRMDKKRMDGMIDFIVLEKIGQAAIHALPFTVIEKAMTAYETTN